MLRATCFALRFIWLAVLALLACLFGCGAARATPPAGFSSATSCETSEYHRLDFWLGEWNVTSAGKLDGTNVVAKVLGGCAIEERWSDADGSSGKSLFTFDRALGKWKQTWATSVGTWKEKREIEIDFDGTPGTVRFLGEVPRPGGGTALDRTTLTPLAGGRVLQVIERSTDGGATWERWEGLYVKTNTSMACSDAAHRAFDFWLGDWDLVVKVRKPGEPEAWDEAHGVNEIRATHGGCVIEERFRAEGPGEPWAGHSVSVLVDGRWRQTWVDDQASYMLFVGGFEAESGSDGENGKNGKKMILEGEPKERDGKHFRMRMVFTDVTATSMLWRWERTDDEGKTWRPRMLITYRRR